jgi:hypothetical protein
VSGTTIVTEIAVPGANCPWCLQETLERLRGEPGVLSADANLAGQCMTIRHRDVALDRLLAVIGGHLRGDQVNSIERVMVDIDPVVAELHCTHHRGDGSPTA